MASLTDTTEQQRQAKFAEWWDAAGWRMYANESSHVAAWSAWMAAACVYAPSEKSSSTADLIELAATWCESTAKAESNLAVASLWITRAKMLRDGYQPLIARAMPVSEKPVSASEPLDARTFIEAVSAMGFPKGWEHVAEEAERIRQLYVTLRRS